MASTCKHLEGIKNVRPNARGCEECLKMGDSWVHLRLCLTCGHVGCCDDSPARHATAAFDLVDVADLLAQLLAQMFRRRIEQMRRSLGKILRIDPARADHGPIKVMLDHAFERPGSGAVLQTERSVEIETVFAFEVRANKGGICNHFTVVLDEGQLPLWRSRRLRLFLAVGQSSHFQLDFGLGHKRADFRQAKSGAEAIDNDHDSTPDFLSSRLRLATACCHRGVSSGDIVVQRSRP